MVHMMHIYMVLRLAGDNKSMDSDPSYANVN